MISWTSRKCIECNNSMALWMSLNLVPIYVCEKRKPTKQEIKLAILSFPNKVDTLCKCKYCRYKRLVDKSHTMLEDK